MTRTFMIALHVQGEDIDEDATLATRLREMSYLPVARALMSDLKASGRQVTLGVAFVGEATA
jgi:hypothetical protein